MLFAFDKYILAVIIHFLFLEAYPSIWRVTPAVFVPSSSLRERGDADCFCFLIYSSPILKITWPLLSKESSGAFLYCHYISRNQTVAFQWHWSALPALVDAASLGPCTCVCPTCKSVLNSHKSGCLTHFLWSARAPQLSLSLASLSPFCMSRKHFCFLLGRHHQLITVTLRSQGSLGSSILCEGFSHKFIINIVLLK